MVVVPTEKIPPQSLENERCVLGSLLLDREMVGVVLEILEPDDFYRGDHQTIYRAIVELYNANKPVDLVMVPEALRKAGQIDAVGGVKYLAELAECVPSAANAEHYAEVVLERALLRRMISACDATLAESYSGIEDTTVVLERAERRVFEVAQRKVRGEVTHLGTVLLETFKQIELQAGKPITGVPTGFFELDDITSGFQKGELIIVAARPSMGKSAFVFNMAEYMALNENFPVAIFSLEMSKQQVAQRMLCSHARIDAHKLRMGQLEAADFQQMSKAVGHLAEAPIYIDDSTGVTLFEMRAKARRLKMRHNIQAVFIDYLQLMECPEVKGQGRTQEISMISRGLKAIARELECPVITLSQLNRGPEGREEHRPRMSDLRESGSIEQDADVVLLLHRPDYYDHKALPVAEVIIAKQRNGPTGSINLTWDSKLTRFKNYSTADLPTDYQTNGRPSLADSPGLGGPPRPSSVAIEPAPF